MWADYRMVQAAANIAMRALARERIKIQSSVSINSQNTDTSIGNMVRAFSIIMQR